MFKELGNMLNQKRGAISLQVSIIAANIYLIYFQNNANSFLLMSITFVLSLFCLQVVSRRFLLFYPIQNLLKEPTKMVDTFLLRTFIILSIFFLILGGVLVYSDSLKAIEFNLRVWCWALVPFLILILPVAWHFIFDEQTRSNLVSKLKKKIYVYSEECPKCDKLSPITIEVLSQNTVKKTYNCECGTSKYISAINIGY